MITLKTLLEYVTGHVFSILGYHSISDDASDVLSVSVDQFSAQMDILHSQGYRVVSLGCLLSDACLKSIEKKTVILTFDDGYSDFLSNALPILMKYKYPATLFIVPGQVGGCSSWQVSNLRKPLLDWPSVIKVSGMGYEIGSHSLNHRRLTGLSDSELNDELASSRKMLEDKILKPVECFSYPWGDFGPREEEAVRASGYKCAVTVRNVRGNRRVCNTFQLERKIMIHKDSLADFMAKASS